MNIKKDKQSVMKAGFIQVKSSGYTTFFVNPFRLSPMKTWTSDFLLPLLNPVYSCPWANIGKVGIIQLVNYSDLGPNMRW